MASVPPFVIALSEPAGSFRHRLGLPRVLQSVEPSRHLLRRHLDLALRERRERTADLLRFNSALTSRSEAVPSRASSSGSHGREVPLRHHAAARGLGVAFAVVSIVSGLAYLRSRQ